ncbi:flagellar filament capping protein FliD [Aquabacterium sp.]|uniref:flagellar filament capping protein FliD n=1 Tax=Aquabacterium sp. TaxID=1872578 RepID=UPI0035B1B83B
MATISSAGSGTGLDITGIPALQAVQSRVPSPPAAAETQSAQASLSAMGRLHGALSVFLDAAQTMTSTDTWSATQASSDNEAVSATSDSQAATSQYDVTVASLAQAQITTSAIFSGSNAVIGLGTLHFEIGSWNAGRNTFTPNPNWPKSDILVDANDNSLERIRDRINAAGVGVIASVLSDVTGSWLVLRSTGTGSTNGFKVSATDETGQQARDGLAALGFDGSGLSNQMQLTQSAADASGAINGKPFASSDNVVADQIPGVSLQLQAPTTRPATITIEPETDSIKQAVNRFAEAYNDLHALVENQLSHTGDDVTRQTALAVQTHMNNITGQSATQDSGLANWLAGLGVTVQADRSVHVDNKRLEQAVSSSNLPQTQRLVSRATSLASPDSVSTTESSSSSLIQNRLATQYGAINQTPPSGWSGLYGSSH